jgi:hypothetical protein
MANQTGDPRGPGMKGSGGWFPVGVEREEYVTNSTPGDVLFNFADIAPWDGIYVREDDALQVTVIPITGSTINLQYRILSPNGTVLVSQDNVPLGVARSLSFFSRQLAEGVLLSVAVVPTGPVPSAAVNYVSVGLRRQNLGVSGLHQVLCAGYVTQACPLSWPGAVLQRPTDGAGTLRSVTGTTPAAGADISEVVPVGTRWQLLSLFAQLTSAVAVASRQVNLTLDDGANIFYETPNGPVQAASLVWEYNFAPCGFAPAVVLTDVAMHYDNSQTLLPGFHIRTDTVAIQAADQWTAPQYLVREWQDNV